MDWAAVALIGTALFGVVSVTDKYLLSKYLSLRAFFLWVGIYMVLYGGLVLALEPLPSSVPASVLGWALISGLGRAGGVLIAFNALRSQEVSRVIPVMHSFPVFVAILAVLFLGETLTAWQWLAVMVIVAGAVLVAWRAPGGDNPQQRLSRPLMMVFLGSFLVAVSNTTGKYVLDSLSFWNLYSIGALILGAMCLAISLRARVLREVGQSIRRGYPAAVVTFNEILALVVAALSLLAISLGPVTLVSSLLATRPFFVFVYSTALSLALPRVLREPLKGRVLLLKSLSILMIVGGTGFLTLR